MNGIFTLRYAGSRPPDPGAPAGEAPAPGLWSPRGLGSRGRGPRAWLPPERLRQELAEFIHREDEGVISPEEYDRIKASLLQRMSA